jgi:hypothetical protein
VANEYVTVDEFKVTAELTGSNFADYDIPMALSAASRGIDEYAGRVFYQSSGTQQMFYEWTGKRNLPTDDIISLGTVQVDFDRDGVYETTWTQDLDFKLEPFNAPFFGKPYEQLGLLPRASYFKPYWYPALVRVTGTFGFASVPEPVKQATTILASRLLRRAREAPFGVVGLGIDGAGVRISNTNFAVQISKLDVDVAFLLEPFLKGDGVMAA